MSQNQRGFAPVRQRTSEQAVGEFPTLGDLRIKSYGIKNVTYQEEVEFVWTTDCFNRAFSRRILCRGSADFRPSGNLRTKRSHETRE